MATLIQISDAIDLGKAYYTELVSSLISDLKNGSCNHNLNTIQCLRRLVRALDWDVEIEEIDDTTVTLYGMLLRTIAPYTGSTLPVNPNVYIPGVTIAFDLVDQVMQRSNINLLQDDNLNWYLPMIDDSGHNVVTTSAFVLYNGVELPGKQLDTTYVPNRIYGFIDDSPASIYVTYTGS